MKKEEKEIKEELKKTKHKKKAFTLIELLAVVIILGILMVIAVPAVTKYINDSRKTTYVNSAKNLIGATMKLANSGRLDISDTNVVYYIPVEYIKTDNDLKTPYGDFTEAYIGIVSDDVSHSYYWISRDSAGKGFRDIVPMNEIGIDLFEEDIPQNEITNKIRTTPLENKQIIKILDVSTGLWETIELNNNLTISSCEDCVYMYTTNTLTFGTNGTVLQASDYKENYLDVIQNNGKVFFGLKLNPTTKKITKAYVCGIDEENSNTPFCIEGIRDNDSDANTKFTHNADLLESMPFGNTCYRDTKHIDCSFSAHRYTALVEQYSSNPWEVSVYENIGYDMNGCFITGDGRLSCGIR